MQINYDDLVTHLNESEDWQQIEDSADWLIYNGPNDIYGEPLQIALPSNPDSSDIQTHMTIAVGILATIAGIHTDTMADRITPSSVAALMDAIKHFDCEPAIFRVWLMASDHLHGYDAHVDFRTGSSPRAASLATHAHTPEKALAGLLTELKARWEHCPQCGRHLDGRDPGKEGTP